MYNASEISGQAADGYSSGEAISAIKKKLQTKHCLEATE